MRKTSHEPTMTPPPPPLSGTTTTTTTTTTDASESKSNSSHYYDDRPLRPAVASNGTNSRLSFPSGRSSYNLNFVDWENEWETQMDEELGAGGFEIEEHEYNDEDEQLGINWVQEYQQFWECVDAGGIDRHGSSTANSSSSSSSSSSNSSTHNNGNQDNFWDAQRIERLQHSIEERGGLPPLNALGLNTRRFNAHQEAVTCGICLEDLEPNDLLFEFCHPFHVKCMRPWFMRAHDCPLCRGDLLQYCCVNMNEEEQEKNK